MAESTEARVQALMEQIRIFARLRIQETKTAASEDFRATEQHFDKLEFALRAELGKDAERLDADRYRWLREHSDSMSLNPPLTVAKVMGWGLEGWSGDDLDSAIDKARAAIQQTKDTK